MKYKYNGQWVDVNIKALDSMAIGCIIQFMGTTIPTGWLECDGSTITQANYPELYDLIGGTLPDFRGRVLVGQKTSDTDFDTLGETGGSKYLQSHNHSLDQAAGSKVVLGNAMGGTYNKVGLSYNWTTYADTGNEIYSGDARTTVGQVGNSGNLQPYAVVKHIIKAKNTVPTMASIVDAYSTSTTDGYSCNYVNNLINIIYPVGSIYMSTSSANPSNLFGGTWEAWGSGKVPVGVNTSDSDFNTVEKTGGSKSNTLTYPFGWTDDGRLSINQANWNSGGLSNLSGQWTRRTNATDYATGIYSGTETQKSVTLSSVQPYITCYMWKRTA